MITKVINLVTAHGECRRPSRNCSKVTQQYCPTGRKLTTPAPATSYLFRQVLSRHSHRQPSMRIGKPSPQAVFHLQTAPESDTPPFVCPGGNTRCGTEYDHERRIPLYNQLMEYVWEDYCKRVFGCSFVRPCVSENWSTFMAVVVRYPYKNDRGCSPRVVPTDNQRC